MKQKEIKELADIVWAPSTAYVADDFCENGDRLYQCFTGGTSAAAGGPLTEADDITDNGVHWRFIEAIGENQTAYAYRYPVPADCIRIKTLGNDGDQYDKIGGLIYTDALAISTTADGPVLRYVYRCTNYNLWDNLMIDALTLRLAGVLSPIIKGKPGTDFMSEFASIAQIAMTKQASEAKQKPKSSGLWTDQV